MSLSIGDLIAQFKDPKPEPEDNPAQEWFLDFQEWLVSDYEKTVHHDRKPGLHASSLGSICARRSMVIAAYGARRYPHTAGNYFTFDVGHALHFWWQERYLGPRQELIGDWKCMACECVKCGPLITKLGSRAPLSREDKQRIFRTCKACQGTGRKVTHGLMPLDCDCGTPWQDSISYMELPVVHKELDYVGHCDGILDHSPKKRLFEFKTISVSEYERNFIKAAVPAPKADHVVQAHAYMVPLGLEEAIILYENKGSQCEWKVDRDGQFIAGEAKLKPFLVRFDQELWDGIVLRIHDHHRAMEIVKDFKEQGKQLPRATISEFTRVCSDDKCEMAKRCSMARECFSLD